MHKYHTLDAWKHAHAAALQTLKTTDSAYHPRARSLFDQIRRAAVSVEANVVEGYALGTTPQFRRHLLIARGSAAEAECLTRLAVELGYLKADSGKVIENSLSGSMRAIHGLLKAGTIAKR